MLSFELIGQILLSAFVSASVSLITYYTNDRLHGFLNRSGDEEKVRNTAPSIYIARGVSYSKERHGSKHIYEVNLKETPFSSTYYVFSHLWETPDPKEYYYFIRCKNTSDSGVSLRAFFTNGNQKILISEFEYKDIDINDEVVLFFNYDSLPEKIAAVFKGYELTYSLKDRSSIPYTPPCSAKKILFPKSRGLDTFNQEFPV